MSYPHQGGYQQPGGYPQQQPGFQQPGGYQQQPGYQQPAGYPPYPPRPPKNNTAIIVGVGVVVVAAVVAIVLVVTLGGGDDKTPDSAGAGGNPSVTIPPANGPTRGGADPGGSGGVGSARALADATTKIIEDQDTSRIDELACSSSAATSLKRELAKLEGANVTASVADVRESGNTAQARITMKINGKTQDITLEMAKKSSQWCASGI